MDRLPFHMRAFQIIVSILAGLALGITTSAFAWSGPTASPPSGNVSAPLNVGTASQVKNGSLGVNGLGVFGNALLQAGSYLNWGSVAGTGGYGIRDNSGTLEFKNSGGSWASLQSTIYNYLSGGGASQWTTSGTSIYYNGGNVGIGTASPGQQLTLTGNVQASNYYLGYLGNWLSNLLNQSVANGASPYFSNVYIYSRGMWMSETARQDGGQFWIGFAYPSFTGQCPGGSVMVGIGYYSALCQWIN